MNVIPSTISPVKVASQPIPTGTRIVQVGDLNGQFAPQAGNIQPVVVGCPEPVQIEVIHSADDGDGDIAAVKIDDWVTTTKSKIPRDAPTDAALTLRRI